MLAKALGIPAVVGCPGVASLRSGHYMQLGDGNVSSERNPIMGVYPTKDGRWSYIHANFPNHRAAALRVLGCEENRAAVRQAVAGQVVKAPTGLEIKMDEKNHHLHKPVFIGEVQANGQFQVVWKTPGAVRAMPWSPFVPDSKDKVADWTYPWVCGNCTTGKYKVASAAPSAPARSVIERRSERRRPSGRATTT